MNFFRRIVKLFSREPRPAQIATAGLESKSAKSVVTIRLRCSGGSVVEFVGGPLDGYTEYLDEGCSERLEQFIRLPVTRALLHGVRPGPARIPPTSIAVYELVCLDDIHLQYVFCGSAPPVASMAD